MPIQNVPTLDKVVAVTDPAVVSFIIGSGGETVNVFELDSYGDLMPSETVGSDANFETDANGDLMPKDV